MKHTIDQVLYRLLTGLQIPVSYQLIREKLLSHPDYPSLFSITDTLEDLGIAHEALIVQKSKFNEIPCPFIIHLSSNGGDFYVVENADDFIKKHPEVFLQWDGVVLVAEKTSHPISVENTRVLRKEKLYRNKITATLSLLALLSLGVYLTDFSVTSLFVLISAIAGIFISVLIAQHETGNPGILAQQLCSRGKQTDCNAVLHSRASRLPFGLHWSDIGVIYFTSYWLLFLISTAVAQLRPLQLALVFFSILSVPVIIFSVYYQWRIAKKWCVLCLLTMAVLSVQLLLLLPTWSNSVLSTVAPVHYGVVAFVFLLVQGSWLLLRPLLEKKKVLTDLLMPLLRFKKNPDVFLYILSRQRRVDVKPFEHDLQLGNPDATLQFMVVCNPYCRPCAVAHKVLHEMMGRISETIGLTVRFAVSSNPLDTGRITVEYLLGYIFSQTRGKNMVERARVIRDCLHDWFSVMNLEKFRQGHPVSISCDVSGEVQEHVSWAEKVRIDFTPSIFLNGSQIPSDYTVQDIYNLVRSLADKMNEVPSNRQSITA